MENIINQNPFLELISQQLSSVIFVQDYLQLDFDGFTITFYEWPLVIIKEKSCNIEDDTYRNTICSLISHEIKDAILVDDIIFELIFENDNKITLNLETVKGEVIYYTTPTDAWGSI